MALFKIPVSSTRGTYFDYQGIQITLSAFRYNPYLGKDAWIMDLSWEEENVIKTIGGIVLSAGTNILQQYSAPIPSLFILSSDLPNDDPVSTTDINLYIKDNS